VGGRREARKIYVRGDQWWGYIPVERGRGRRESLDIPATADESEALAEWLARAGVQRAADKAAHTPRFGEAVNAYLAEQKRRGRADATREIDDTKARHLARIIGAHRPLRTIRDASVAAEYIEKRESEGAARGTIARELVVLSGILKLAIHRGKFGVPLERVMPIDYARKYVPRTRRLSIEVAKAMYYELPEERRGWFAFAIATGARKSEVERARLEDIGERAVDIHGTKTERSAAATTITSIQRWWLEQAKKRAAREGPAFGKWTNVLRGLDHARLALETCPDCRAGNGPHCVGPKGNVLLRRKPDPKCPRCAAMPKIGKISPNDLRRSLGFWLRDAGVDPHLIGPAILRHVDSRMAELVYARGTPKGLADLIESQIRRGRVVPRRVPQGRKKPQRMANTKSRSTRKTA